MFEDDSALHYLTLAEAKGTTWEAICQWLQSYVVPHSIALPQSAPCTHRR